MDNNKLENIELRSEEVQEILTKVPHWMIRWGNVLFMALIVLILVISYFIKYPDIIVSEAVITTKIPPQKLISRSTGKFDSIFVKDNQFVNNNQLLAILENPANYNHVLQLKNILSEVEINNDSIYFPLESIPANFNLGEVENAYVLFENAYIEYEVNKQLQPYSYQVTAGNNTVLELQTRLNNLYAQYDLKQQELKLAKSDLKRNETLFEKGVISAQDFENKQLMYAQAQRDFKNFQTTISQLKQAISDAQNNLRGTEIGQIKDDRILFRKAIQSYNQLNVSIKDWELRYVFRSNLEGKVSFLNIWHENQNINQGDLVFTILPSQNENYIARLKTPTQNSGKIEKGQIVNIKLNNYPEQEFGVLKGKIDNVSLIPDEEGFYRIDVTIPNDLITTYQKKLEFKQEMTGTAEIITEDLRLIERLLYQFRELLIRQ